MTKNNNNNIAAGTVTVFVAVIIFYPAASAPTYSPFIHQASKSYKNLPEEVGN
jgi:hypothetical protein